MLKFINKKIFIISFLVGLLLIIFLETEKEKVVVYPTVENVKEIEYVDKNGLCYEYRQELVKCPANSNNIKKIPIQN